MPLMGLDRDAAVGVLQMEQVIAWRIGGFGWETMVSCNSRERKTQSIQLSHSSSPQLLRPALWAVTGEAKN